MTVEERLGIRFNTKEIGDLKDVGDLVRVIKAKCLSTLTVAYLPYSKIQRLKLAVPAALVRHAKTIPG